MTEDAFLEKLFSTFPPSPPELVVPPGDDCAGFRVGRGRLLLATVDQVIAGRHYRLSGRNVPSAGKIGRKLVARNLSDIAAMGGTPLYGLITAGFAKNRPEKWMREFFAGVVKFASERQVKIIGGDLAAVPGGEVFSMTVLGEVKESRVCRRSGARPGEELFATGSFGRSFETGHHLDFEPRCREGQWLAERGYPSCMIDVSDGLLLDAGRLCRASRAGLVLYAEKINRRTNTTTLKQALSDGEDYELLFGVPRGKAGRLVREWPFPAPLGRIGTFTSGSAVRVIGADGRLIPVRNGGWDHFRRQGRDKRI